MRCSGRATFPPPSASAITCYSLSRLMGHSSVKITEIYLEDFKSHQAHDLVHRFGQGPRQGCRGARHERSGTRSTNGGLGLDGEMPSGRVKVSRRGTRKLPRSISHMIARERSRSAGGRKTAYFPHIQPKSSSGSRRQQSIQAPRGYCHPLRGQRVTVACPEQHTIMGYVLNEGGVPTLEIALHEQRLDLPWS
jgi:hypothetical protein